MRHILCNYARDRSRKKRGGEIQHVSLGKIGDSPAQSAFSDDAAETLAAVGDALERLDQIDKRQSQVVECRFFAGLSVEDTAAALDISPATVKRDWTLARAWLYRAIQAHGSAA